MRNPWKVIIVLMLVSAPLLSGYLIGEKFFHGKAAALDTELGAGHVVLIGFHPQWRCQPFGTFRVVFNAALYEYGNPCPEAMAAPAQRPAPAGIAGEAVSGRSETLYDVAGMTFRARPCEPRGICFQGKAGARKSS